VAASFINCLNFVCSLPLNMHCKVFLKFCCFGNRLWKSCSILKFRIFMFWILKRSKMFDFLNYKNRIWFSKKVHFPKRRKIKKQYEKSLKFNRILKKISIYATKSRKSLWIMTSVESLFSRVYKLAGSVVHSLFSPATVASR